MIELTKLNTHTHRVKLAESRNMVDQKRKDIVRELRKSTIVVLIFF